jgi:hypothetical protein
VQYISSSGSTMHYNGYPLLVACRTTADLVLYDSYDYFSRSSCFFLRKPTYTHEAFISSVTFDIQRQLEEITKGTDTRAEFAKQIKHIGSPKLRFPIDDADEEKTVSNKGEEQLGGGERSGMNLSLTSKYNPHEILAT